MFCDCASINLIPAIAVPLDRANSILLWVLCVPLIVLANGYDDGIQFPELKERNNGGVVGKIISGLFA